MKSFQTCNNFGSIKTKQTIKNTSADCFFVKFIGCVLMATRPREEWVEISLVQLPKMYSAILRIVYNFRIPAEVCCLLVAKLPNRFPLETSLSNFIGRQQRLIHALFNLSTAVLSDVVNPDRFHKFNGSSLSKSKQLRLNAVLGRVQSSNAFILETCWKVVY